MKFLFDLLKRFLKGITYDWIVALVDMLRRVWGTLKRLFGCQPPHSETNTQESGCGSFDHPSFHRPDPTIYSQDYLMSLGLAVTWDNPDISLFKNGVQANEGTLEPNTVYEIRATIWNNSYDAPIVGLRVDFAFMSFGVTTLKNAIGSTSINLGVKGGAQHPAIATMLWTTPPAGHYCIVVEFQWADDANPNNNVGQNNTNVVAAQSPAEFQFTVRNQSDQEHSYRIEADTYTLPERHDCSDAPKKKQTKAQQWRELQSIHNRAAFPVPAGWTVDFSPSVVALAPDEEQVIDVSITPPNDFLGQKPFNIHAVTEAGEYVGGVTVTVIKA